MEPIHRDPLLGDKAQASFAGNKISLARLRHAPPPKAMRQMQRAQQALAEGDHAECVKRLQKAIEIHPEFIEALNNLGVQYSKMGRWEDAVKQFQRAAELDPAAAFPHQNLALSLQMLGENEAALFNAEEALRLAPQDAGVHFNMGTILAQQDRRLSDAVAHLSRAESHYPEASLIKAEVLLRQDKPRDAQVALRSFLALTPGKAIH